MSAEEVRRLIDEAQEAPHGTGKIALAEEAIRRADALGEPGLRFDARMAGTTAYTFGGEPAKAFVTFSWCLAEFDRSAGAAGAAAGLDPETDAHLRWHFKWIAGAMTSFPELPLERTYAVLDDMERRYRLGGHSLHAVYAQRWAVADHVGDVEAAAGWYAKWCAAPRDENSDCQACDPSAKAAHLTALGRDEEAIALAEPVLTGQLNCVEQPQRILTGLLVPYLRTGRLDRAVDAHLRGYRGFRGNISGLRRVADHIEFCALTGNEPRGLEILQRHLEWLERSPTPFTTMAFAAAAGLLLRRLTGAGHGGLTLRRGPEVAISVADLADELAGTALVLAARFDARNGTPHWSARVGAQLAAEPLVEQLPLSAVERRLRAAPPSGPESTPLPIEYPDDPGELLDLADRLYRLGRGRAATAAWQAFDERYPAEGLAPPIAARRADARGRRLANDEHYAEAEPAWREAIDGYGRAGDAARRLIAQGRLGALLCQLGRDEEGLALVEESSRALVASAEPERRVSGELRLAHAYLTLERFDDALAAVERAAGHAELVTEPLVVAEVAERHAQVLLTLGRPMEALAAAGTARLRYTELGSPPAIAMADLLYAHALMAAASTEGEAARAAEIFALALAHTEHPDLALAAHQARGQALLAAQQPAAAVEHLVEAVAGFAAAGQEDAAALGHFDLARAYYAAGQPLDAAAAAEAALGAFDRQGAQVGADRCRYLLSRLYLELDEPDQALALLDRLAANLDGYDNAAARGQIYEDAANILYRLDRDGPAAQRFTDAATCYAAARMRMEEVRARRWAALAWHWAGLSSAGEQRGGRTGEALAALAAADAAAEALPVDEPAATWERAMLRYDGAKVLIGAERFDDALDRLAGVAGEFRSIEAFGEAHHVELLHGELLLRMNRPERAEPLLRAVLAAMPRGSGPQQNAAWLLSEVLVLLGRADEAADLRREHELDE